MSGVNPQKTASKRCAEPFVAARTIIVAAQIIQIHVQHPDRMRSVNAYRNLMTACHFTDRLHRKNAGCSGSHMTHHDHARLLGDGRFNGCHNPVLGGRKRQHRVHDLCTRFAAFCLPNVADRAVFMVGQNDLITVLQSGAACNHIHREGRVVHKGDAIRLRLQKCRQYCRSAIKFLFHVLAEETHWLTFQTLRPACASLLDRPRGGTERAMVEIRAGRVKLPERGKRMSIIHVKIF